MKGGLGRSRSVNSGFAEQMLRLPNSKTLNIGDVPVAFIVKTLQQLRNRDEASVEGILGQVPIGFLLEVHADDVRLAHDLLSMVV